LKLVQEGAGNTLEAIGIGMDFFRVTQVSATKRNDQQIGLHKIKKLLHKKEVSKLKRPPNE
jgi:alpha-D-ribose 1-methylphosphonate 5-phosphate C-P lyase